MFRKGKSAVEVHSKKSWCEIEAEKRFGQKEVELEVSLVGIHQEEGGLTFSWIERKTPMLRPGAPVDF